MRSYKAAISLIARKRLFSETIQSLFSHSPFKGQCRLPLCRRLSCFTKNQCVVQVREQKFAWHSSESLGKEKHIQSKASRGASRSKPSKTILWVLSLSRTLFCEPRFAILEYNRYSSNIPTNEINIQIR